ncbi:MAG: hypothetical protein IPJ45_09010 [Ignavibacteria bacterium]|nr:hypothetical protein [Ignavibacteria bacterium]
MNKYFVKIPYSYTQYATLSGYVFSNDDEEAIEVAESLENIHEEAYEDCDDSGDSNYDFENIDAECVETDVPRESIPQTYRNQYIHPEISNLPNYFLEDLPALISNSTQAI